MRRLQQVLANQLSLRHHGWTLSGLAVMATHGLCPISSTALPQVIVSAPAVAKAGSCYLNLQRHQARLSSKTTLASIYSRFQAAGTGSAGRGLQQTRGR